MKAEKPTAADHDWPSAFTKARRLEAHEGKHTFFVASCLRVFVLRGAPCQPLSPKPIWQLTGSMTS
jgi:hypothetical protein